MELFTRAPGHARMNIPPDPTSRAATRSTIRWAVVAAYNANPPRWRNVTEEKRTPVLPPITTAFCATAPSEREMERRKEREREREREREKEMEMERSVRVGFTVMGYQWYRLWIRD